MRLGNYNIYFWSNIFCVQRNYIFASQFIANFDYYCFCRAAVTAYIFLYFNK